MGARNMVRECWKTISDKLDGYGIKQTQVHRIIEALLDKGDSDDKEVREEKKNWWGFLATLTEPQISVDDLEQKALAIRDRLENQEERRARYRRMLDIQGPVTDEEAIEERINPTIPYFRWVYRLGPVDGWVRQTLNSNLRKGKIRIWKRAALVCPKNGDIIKYYKELVYVGECAQFAEKIM